MSNEIIKIISQCGFLSTAPGVAQITDANGNWGPLSAAASVNVQQIEYVAKNGSDTTGDGSFGNPFLTVQGAMNAILDATSTKVYVISVAPGAYTDPFTIKNGVVVVGSGYGSPDYNGSAPYGVTILAPTAAQVLAASWAGAGAKFGGIMNCALSTALTIDFNAIANTSGGLASFLIKDVFTNSNVIATGNAAALAAIGVENLWNNSPATVFRLVNIALGDVKGLYYDFGASVDIQQSAAIQAFISIAASIFTSLSCTWTSALLANFLGLSITGTCVFLNPTITGDGASVFWFTQTINRILADAAQTFAWGATAGAASIGLVGGINLLTMTPTAARVLTIPAPGGAQATRILIKNLSPTFPIDLSLGGTVSTGSPTYVPPLGQVELTYIGSGGNSRWFVQPYVQSFGTTLVAGVSPNIPADISANSRVVATLKNYSGVCGTIQLNAQTNGTRAGGGLFSIKAITPATGATTVTDTGDYSALVNQS